MQYAASLPFNGDIEKAFGLAETALTAIGFRLTKRTADSLEAIGPGMNSTGQIALVGASRIYLHADHRELTADAELGGALWMARFLTLFPLGLCLFLAIVITVVFSVVLGKGPWIFVVAAVAGGNAVLWLMLGPVIARRIRTRTCQAIDAMLENLVAVGQSTET